MIDIDDEQNNILDKKAAIEGLGDIKLFETMIKDFNKGLLKESLNSFNSALDNFDYHALQTQVHSLKGSLSYLHTKKILSVLDEIQTAIEKQMPEDIFKAYPNLLKQCIIFKRTIKLYLSRKGIII